MKPQFLRSTYSEIADFYVERIDFRQVSDESIGQVFYL